MIWVLYWSICWLLSLIVMGAIKGEIRLWYLPWAFIGAPIILIILCILCGDTVIWRRK